MLFINIFITIIIVCITNKRSINSERRLDTMGIDLDISIVFNFCIKFVSFVLETFQSNLTLNYTEFHRTQTSFTEYVAIYYYYCIYFSNINK